MTRCIAINDGSTITSVPYTKGGKYYYEVTHKKPQEVGWYFKTNVGYFIYSNEGDIIDALDKEDFFKIFQDLEEWRRNRISSFISTT